MMTGWIKVPDMEHTKRCATRHGVMAAFVLVFPSAGTGAKLLGAMTTMGMTMNRWATVGVDVVVLVATVYKYITFAVDVAAAVIFFASVGAAV